MITETPARPTPTRRPSATSDRAWDDFVTAHPFGDLRQTSAWGRVKATSLDVERVVLTGDDGSIRGGAQLLIRPVALGVRIAVVPYGPLAVDDERTSVLELVEDAAREQGAAALVIQGPRGDDDFEAAAEARGFAAAPIDVAPSATIEVDVTRPLDDLRAGLRRSKRKNLKKARKAGVTVRRGDADDLEAFHRLHAASASRQGFTPIGLDYVRHQWEQLAAGGHAWLPVAEIDGRVVGAGLVTVACGVAEFKLTGFALDDETRQAGVNHAIQWELLEWAHDAGIERFDLGGLPRDAAEAMLAAGDDAHTDHVGSTFKLGWGGTVRLFPPPQHKILRPTGRVAYELPARLLGDDGVGSRIVNRLRGRAQR